MGHAEVEAFLSHLAVARDVSASTQNQALQALLFLYRDVLHVNLPWMTSVVRARQSRHVPLVLTHDEVGRVMAHLEGRSPLGRAITLWQRASVDGSVVAAHQRS